MSKIFEAMVVLLMVAAPVYGTPDEVLAVQALIEKFDNANTVTGADFVTFAKAIVSFGECAVDPLIEALGKEGQIRVAAAVGLEAIGPAAIKATPQLIEMLGASGRDNILACGIIRGIGPGAVELVPLLRTLLDNNNFHVQYWACRALSSIGPGAHQATSDLCEILIMGIASVRRNAAIALGNIAPGMTLRQLQETINVLEVIKLRDGCHPVRIEAIEALNKISLIVPPSIPSRRMI